jgi:5-methyltetrahydrofolate--homocysteine methyltransferase
MIDLSQLPVLIMEGDSQGVSRLVGHAVEKGASPADLVTSYVIPAMDEVGRRFESGEWFLPEMLVAGDAAKSAMAILGPLLAASDAQPQGRVVIGTVQGDVHDIGKNLVASMLIGGGYEVDDLGVDAKPAQFVAAIGDGAADVVALSAMLSTTKMAMKTTIGALQDAGVRSGVKVIVGGAPITQGFAEEIGADGYGRTAGGAVDLVRSLLAG